MFESFGKSSDNIKNAISYLLGGSLKNEMKGVCMKLEDVASEELNALVSQLDLPDVGDVASSLEEAGGSDLFASLKGLANDVLQDYTAKKESFRVRENGIINLKRLLLILKNEKLKTKIKKTSFQATDF